MKLHMVTMLDTSDAVLMSAAECAAFLTPVPRSEFWLLGYEDQQMHTRYPAAVRKQARQERDAELLSAVNGAGQVAA